MTNTANITNNVIAFEMAKKEVIEKNITALSSSLKDAQKSLHLLACQCMLHHFKHGDTTLMVKLVDGLPKAIRKADLLRWIIYFGAFDYDIKNGLTHSKEKADALKDKIVEQVNNAFNTPFYELNKDKEVVKKTFLDMLKDIEKKVVYDLENRKEPRFTVNDLADIRKLIKAREAK